MEEKEIISIIEKMGGVNSLFQYLLKDLKDVEFKDGSPGSYDKILILKTSQADYWICKTKENGWQYDGWDMSIDLC